MSYKTEAATVVETQTFVKKPKLFVVIMHNDDITTMDFVVDVLVKVFHKSTMEASNIMMDIHNNGSGVAGVYTYDIAVTKKAQTEQRAFEKGFPLKITMDETQD